MVQALSYDPWGRLRNPSSYTHAPYAPGSEPTPMFGQGYTGHEHLSAFGLINMNARLYDPILSRFISPDPAMQTPFMLNGFNCYTYGMNNPLAYIDQDGEIGVLAIIGIAAAVGGIINVAVNWDAIKAEGDGWKSFWKGMEFFGVGAVAGGTSAFVGCAVASGLGAGALFTITSESYSLASASILGGAAISSAEGATNGFILDSWNSYLKGSSFGDAMLNGLNGAASGGFTGALTGGIFGGIQASQNGTNIWTGAKNAATPVPAATVQTSAAAQAAPNDSPDKMAFL